MIELKHIGICFLLFTSLYPTFLRYKIRRWAQRSGDLEDYPFIMTMSTLLTWGIPSVIFAAICCR